MANHVARKGMLIDVQPFRTQEEIREMIEALGMSKNGLRDQMLFKFGISTGLRAGDLVALRIDQVKGKSSFRIREGKTEKERIVYLNPILSDLMDYLGTLTADEVYLFGNGRGGHLSVTQAYRILQKAGDMIGNHSIGTHSLRKSFGYRYYQETKDVGTLMEIFNHSSQKITLRYIGISDETIENSLKNISFY